MLKFHIFVSINWHFERMCKHKQFTSSVDELRHSIILLASLTLVRKMATAKIGRKRQSVGY